MPRPKIRLTYYPTTSTTDEFWRVRDPVPEGYQIHQELIAPDVMTLIEANWNVDIMPIGFERKYPRRQKLIEAFKRNEANKKIV